LNLEINETGLTVNSITELMENGDLEEYAEIIQDEFYTENFKSNIITSVL
jgi:hypothetical protein